jgi:hypothetical protein
MDYLNPHKQFQHRIILIVGYVLIAIGIIIATTILLYEAYGFGLGKNGTVIQNGLVFLSSQPNPADISLNGKPYNNSTTNTRLLLPAGIYNVTLSRQGYDNWQRTINVQGGTVMHYDYPFLFPSKLITTKLQNYSGTPGLVTQSPDRRWLIVQQPGSETNFDLYDLKNRDSKPTTFSIPSSILSKATTNESWQLDEWADDNQHVVLEHNYDGKTEFILVDRTNPDQSINLNTTLNANPTKLTLNNVKYDQYYLYDGTSQTLETASLSSLTLQPYLDHVLAYQSYGSDSMLYATQTNAPSDMVLVKLQVGNQTYIIHSFVANTNYLLDLTQYAGTLYVVAGASSEDKVYIFKDPVGQLSADPSHAVVPTQVLHLTAPNYVSFSDNTQFIMAEHSNQFGVYDIYNKQSYSYTTKQLLDTPQVHAAWMDGDRLTYMTNGKLYEFDYDDTNAHVLNAMSPAYLPYFSSNYQYVYGLTDNASKNQFTITQTSLLIPADQ